MRSFMILVIILIVWIILAPSCMTFRETDTEMKKDFEEHGVTLTTVSFHSPNNSLESRLASYESLSILPTVFPSQDFFVLLLAIFLAILSFRPETLPTLSTVRQLHQ